MTASEKLKKANELQKIIDDYQSQLEAFSKKGLTDIFLRKPQENEYLNSKNFKLKDQKYWFEMIEKYTIMKIEESKKNLEEFLS